MFSKKLMRLFTAVCLFTVATFTHAETTLVAVAANFTKPMTEIATVFEKETGHSAKR